MNCCFPVRQRASCTPPPSRATAVPVFLRMVDVSQGMAGDLSLLLLGRALDGVWCSTVVVGNLGDASAREYYYDRRGCHGVTEGGTRFRRAGQVRGGRAAGG